jgi:hypothetical protein
MSVTACVCQSNRSRRTCRGMSIFVPLRKRASPTPSTTRAEDKVRAGSPLRPIPPDQGAGRAVVARGAGVFHQPASERSVAKGGRRTTWVPRAVATRVGRFSIDS